MCHLPPPAATIRTLRVMNNAYFSATRFLRSLLSTLLMQLPIVERERENRDPMLLAVLIAFNRAPADSCHSSWITRVIDMCTTTYTRRDTLTADTTRAAWQPCVKHARMYTVYSKCKFQSLRLSIIFHFLSKTLTI